MRRLSGVALWLAVAITAIGSAHDSFTLVRFVTGLETARPATAADADVVAADVMATMVAATLADVLGVAPPPYIVLRVYGSRADLQHGLVRDLGVPWRVADEVSGFATGLALRRSVTLLNDGADDDRLRLMAHELTHVMQLELGGPDARPAQWLMEGTAEWAAFEVVERLGGAGIAERREAAHHATRRYLLRDPAFDPASADAAAGFRWWQRRVGDVLAYQVAYALADSLVERSGVAAVVEYFRALGGGADHAAAFAHAFAITPTVLVGEVQRRAPPSAVQPVPAASAARAA